MPGDLDAQAWEFRVQEVLACRACGSEFNNECAHGNWSQGRVFKLKPFRTTQGSVEVPGLWALAGHGSMSVKDLFLGENSINLSFIVAPLTNMSNKNIQAWYTTRRWNWKAGGFCLYQKLLEVSRGSARN